MESYGDSAGIENLTELISTYASSAGTQNAVNFVAGLTDAVKSGDTKSIDELVKSLADLKTEQEETADAYSQLVTDFDDEAKKLVETTQTAVQDLDLSEEAATAAKSTMESYVETVSDSSYARRVQAAFANFKVASRITLADITNPYAGNASGGDSIQGNAKGTSSAPKGWSLVGENGPELMYMQGGERVLNHGDTTRVLRDSNAPASNNSIAVSFNIGGNADSSTVASLRDYADDFAERVMEVISSAQADSARRAYV